MWARSMIGISIINLQILTFKPLYNFKINITMLKLLKTIKYFIADKLFGKITREIRYRKRLKELKKRDPFIYK